MSKIKYTIDVINKTLPAESRLTAISESAPYINNQGKQIRCAIFKCSCGNLKDIHIKDAISGNTKTCGCIMKEGGKHLIKYSGSIKWIAGSYHGMMARCYNPNCSHYKYYGARGVTVCDEWRNNYQNFLDWALANGWQKGLHLDKDIKIPGNKLYSPGTCTWVTKSKNSGFTRRCVRFEYNGEYLTVRELGRKTNIPYWTFRNRMKRGEKDIYKIIDSFAIKVGVIEDETE